MAERLFSGTGRLSRLFIRRDRLRLSIWITAIVLLNVSTAASFTGLYMSEEEKQAMAGTMENPAMTAMLGPGYGLENYHEGAMMAHQMLLFMAVVTAIMNILLVVRHTRADEEEGRVELIRSLPVGRLSTLASTLVVMTVVNTAVALLTGVGLAVVGIESIDFAGSLLFGAALGAAGLFFAGVTALFAQLSESSRGTVGLSFAVLGGAYILRAIGDVSSEGLSLVSPLGLILRTEAYVNNYWWPVFVTIGIAGVLLVLAFYLNLRRDLEAGFLPSRPGKKQASAFLKSPFGLSVRLQRTALISWAVGMVVLGVSYGSVLGDLEAFFEASEMMREILAPDAALSLTEQYLTMLMAVIAMICTVPPLMMMLKLKGEEKKGRIDHLLTRVVSRGRTMGSYFLLAMITSALMLFLAVSGLWAAAAGVMDDPMAFSMVFEAAMVYLPAVWIMIGAAVFLIGVLPKFSGFIWAYLGYTFLVVYLGELLQFPEWLKNLSPFGYVPQVPVEELSFTVLAVLTLVAAVLVIAGFTGYRRRDIAG
ncbi:ABC transporter permease [Alteribacter natronophilus]|uniref:ABC transporter permease n=1 Tax=Alteribacter natronophilus TaxID=2583810 RepID=UPI00110DC25F|nr:ABC transporter permease [Alteribacter natronophilus]TMW72890.1 ABC transporter permease [Alteribacter natronophilus]